MKFIKENLDEVSPPGFEKTVKAMKKHKEIDNPYALAWYMKNKGYKSRKESTNIEEACWDTHMQKGMKMKNGRMVPNCVPKEEVENVDELKMPAKDERGRAKDPKVRKAYKLGSLRADLKAGKKLRKGDAEGAEGDMERTRKRQSASRTPMDEAKIGDTVHLGHATKGGTGVRGKVVKIDGDKVHIKNDKGATFKGPMDRVSVEEAIELDERHLVRHGDGNYVSTTDGERVLTVSPNKKHAKRFSKSMAKRIANQPTTKLVGGKHVPTKRASGEVVRAEEVEQVDELSAKTLKKYSTKARQDHSDIVQKGYDPMTGKLRPGFETRRKKRKAGFTKAMNKLIATKESEVNEWWEKQVNPRSKGWKKATVKMNFKSFNSAGEGPNHFRKGDKLFYHPMKLDNYNVVIAATDPKDSGSYFSVHPDRLGLKGFVSATGALRDHVEPMEEMSAKAHYRSVMRGGKGKGFVVSTPIDRNRYPNREREGLEGPYKSRKSGKIFYYDKKEGKYYDPDSDMFLQVSDVMEEAPKKVKIKLDPKKKIGYEIRSIGPGGKSTVTKRRDMPGKKDVGEGTVEPMIGSKISKGREEYLKSKEGKESLRKRKEQDAKTMKKEEQTPLQRRAEIERAEAKKAEQAARSDVKRRRARKARQEYARERNRRMDMGESVIVMFDMKGDYRTRGRRVTDAVEKKYKKYFDGSGSTGKGYDFTLTVPDKKLAKEITKFVKDKYGKDIISSSTHNLAEEIDPVVSFLEYESLDEGYPKIKKIQDIGPNSPGWKKCKLAAGIRYGGKTYKKGDTVFCHGFDEDRVVIRPTMKDGNAFLRRSSIENPPAPLKEALNQRGRMSRPPGQISKHASGSMGTRPETESPSGQMAREYSRQKMYDKRKPGGGDAAERYKRAKDSVKRLSTQNTTGQSVKTLRRTQGSMDAVAAASKAYKGGNF